MGMPVRQVHTTTGAKTPVSMDWMLTPFNASVYVSISDGGSATFSVQYTLDPINDPNVTPEWIDDANIPTGTTSAAVSNYMFPVTAVRVNIATISGSVIFRVLQGTLQ